MSMRPASTDRLPPGVPSSMLACVRVMVRPAAVYCFARLMPAPSNVSRLPYRGQVHPDVGDARRSEDCGNRLACAILVRSLHAHESIDGSFECERPHGRSLPYAID